MKMTLCFQFHACLGSSALHVVKEVKSELVDDGFVSLLVLSSLIPGCFLSLMPSLTHLIEQLIVGL